ncbi:MAG: phage/plasmid primase, P4 family [Oscillospiraceae bacterium]|nr:phage/plasmid primase, P4 family [Oscillospiraceae bacterium]
MSTWNGNQEAFRTYFHGMLDKDGDCIPAEKVKGMPGHSFEEVCNDENFGAILNEGMLDISFDSKELSDAFWNMAEANDWNCLIFENPKNQQIHSIWKKPPDYKISDGRDKKLACGLIADIHSGSTYIRLKVNGISRFPPSFEPEHIQEVPEELLPVNTNMDLWQMADGDGRNGDLYGYILVLQSQIKADKNIVRRILRNTNDFIFADKLSDDELETIFRDDAFKKQVFFNGSTFLFYRFAAFLKNNYHIVRIERQLHIYQEGVYIRDINSVSSMMRLHIPNIKRNQKAEVLDCLNDIADEKTVANARYIAFRNGILDITSGEMQPHTPEIVITNKIPWDYNPAASSMLVENTLNKISCDDMAIRALIEEMIGYCFYRSNAYKKSFLLVGDGDNGKSTLLYAIKSILGEENISALDLKELGDRFKTAEMFGKLANIGDDISDEFIANATIFKKVVSGDRVSAERKGRDPFEFNPYVKVLLSANDIPQIKDKTGATVNRLLILPFNAVFTRDDPDFNPEIRQDILQTNCMECFIRLGVEGLKRVINNKGFTKSEATEQAVQEYSMINNPIKGFFAEQEEDYIFRATVDEIYLAYQEYCRGLGVKPEQIESKIGFGKSVTKIFKVESYQKKINGKNSRMYRKKQ